MSSEMKRRLMMTISGVVICGFSVGMFQYSTLGMDPFQVFAHGIWNQIQYLADGQGIHLLQEFGVDWAIISYGVVYMILNLVLLIADFILDRKKIGIATFINLFLVGYIVDFSYGIWHRMLPHPSLAVRFLFLIAAIVIMCLSSALYFTSDLGVSTYDTIALALSEQHHWDFKFVRITSDLICVAIGFFFGIMPGIGTIITAFFMGPLISFFNKHVAGPIRYGKNRP